MTKSGSEESSVSHQGQSEDSFPFLMLKCLIYWAGRWGRSWWCALQVLRRKVSGICSL